MPNNALTVIILAAGMGTRLGDIIKDKPKALATVAGKPIVEYSLAFARGLQPKKIIVVGGYLFDKLADAVASIDSSVVLVENKEYQTTQRMVSLMKAQKEIIGGFISYDGDYIYHPSIASNIREQLDDEMKIFGTDDESDEVQLDMMIKVDEKERLIAMSKGLTDYEYYFNSVLYCPESKVGAFFESANEVLQKGDPQKTHVEEAVLAYAKSRGQVKMVDIGYPKWVEIDTPEELAAAERLVGRNLRDFISY